MVGRNPNVLDRALVARIQAALDAGALTVAQLAAQARLHPATIYRGLSSLRFSRSAARKLQTALTAASIPSIAAGTDLRHLQESLQKMQELCRDLEAECRRLIIEAAA
jgi:hypothetical protein